MKHSNFKTNVHNLVLAAMFLALALVLPFLTGQIPQLGGMLLPMHLPVFLCGLICGYDLIANTVTVCDPLEGKIQYDMDKFENRYQLVYQQAVVLRKPESLTGTETETTEMFVQ